MFEWAKCDIIPIMMPQLSQLQAFIMNKPQGFEGVRTKIGLMVHTMK